MKRKRRKVDGGRWQNRSTPLPTLRRLRQSRGLTQQELARMAKVSSGTVYRLENGLRGAYPRSVRKLAFALEVSSAELVREHHPGQEESGPPPARP